MNRKLLTRLVSKRGHTVDDADGRQAVQMVAKAMQLGNPYDTILMDFEMPVVRGPCAPARFAKNCNATS